MRNLSELRELGFNANRRLLQVEKISQDCQLGEQVFDQINRPLTLDGQRAGALKFGDPRVMGLMHALCLFSITPEGFSNRCLRQSVATLFEQQPERYTQGRMTYDLRRLRLHGLIERIRGTHRYQVTRLGLQCALFFTKIYQRVFVKGFADCFDQCADKAKRPIVKTFAKLHELIEAYVLDAKILT